MAKRITIYTDGACSGNPGPGGWGAVLVCHSPRAEREISGGEPETTNNRMELRAIIEALGCLREPCAVTVVTDSQYVANAFRQGWVERWQRNGWRTAAKAPVKNQDLWQHLLGLLERQEQVEWTWVRGHEGHPENERADRLAVGAVDAAKARR